MEKMNGNIEIEGVFKWTESQCEEGKGKEKGKERTEKCFAPLNRNTTSLGERKGRGVTPLPDLT